MSSGNPNSPSDGGTLFVSSIPEAGTTVEVDFGDSTFPKKFAIGYWSIHGLGGPLAMMLCAARVPFTYFLFDLVEKEGDGGASKSWTSNYIVAKQRFALEEGQPLFNLPFCVDRDQKRMIYQSTSISMHLGKACGMLDPDDQRTCSECEQLLGEIYDLRNVMTGYVYGLRREDASQVIASARNQLQRLEGWLELQAAADTSHQMVGIGGSEAPPVHLLNGRFSPPDFHLWELLHQFEALALDTLGTTEYFYQNLPLIWAFKEGFEALPENQFYLGSWLHRDLPFNNCMAHFGSLPGPRTYLHGESAKLATWRNLGFVELSPHTTSYYAHTLISSRQLE